MARRGQSAASQQSVEDFYRGKKIDLIIGYSPGGTYDLYARLVARYLGNYIPGKPLIVPRNMPGAGSRTAATWVYNVAPKDGTVLATADQSLSLQQAAGDKRINFDTTKFIYIGNPNVENNTTATWHTSGIKTIDDAKSREVTMGATGGSTSSQYPKAMNALLGTSFKIILGYPGGNDINLAMERGEVEGRGSNSWASWKATRAALDRREEDQHPGADRPDEGARPAGRSAADGPWHQRRGPRSCCGCCRRRRASGGRSSPRPAFRPSASRRCARRSTRWCAIRRSWKQAKKRKLRHRSGSGERCRTLVAEIVAMPTAAGRAAEENYRVECRRAILATPS